MASSPRLYSFSPGRGDDITVLVAANPILISPAKEEIRR
jgi:hypothetical protein